MCTSPSPAWKTCFCTTLEGACGNELEDVFRHAGTRRSRGPPQHRSVVAANVPAAADVRIYLWPGDGAQRLHACGVQEPAAPRHHGHQHGVHRRVGGCHAVDFRIPVHVRDWRPPAGADRNFLGRGREGFRWRSAGAHLWPGRHSRRMADPAAGSRAEFAYPSELRRGHAARGALLRVRWLSPGMQRQSNPHWPDVQHGPDPDDFLWLHLLSLERTAEFPHPAKGRSGEPLGVCQRGPARNTRPAISPSIAGGRDVGTGALRRAAVDSGTAAVSEQGGQLRLPYLAAFHHVTEVTYDDKFSHSFSKAANKWGNGVDHSVRRPACCVLL